MAKPPWIECPNAHMLLAHLPRKVAKRYGLRCLTAGIVRGLGQANADPLSAAMLMHAADMLDQHPHWNLSELFNHWMMLNEVSGLSAKAEWRHIADANFVRDAAEHRRLDRERNGYEGYDDDEDDELAQHPHRHCPWWWGENGDSITPVRPFTLAVRQLGILCNRPERKTSLTEWFAWVSPPHERRAGGTRQSDWSLFEYADDPKFKLGADLIRDVFPGVESFPEWNHPQLLPSPVPPEFDKGWLTSDVLALARHIWSARDFGSLPILADALQEAGCERPDVLDHLRGDGSHCRGCWVLKRLYDPEKDAEGKGRR